METNHQFILNFEENRNKNIVASLDRYIRYVLRLDEIENLNVKILLVEIHSGWDPDEVIKQLSSDKDEYNNINGIMFFTMEEFPRGDRSDSDFNRSRMLREFFENSFNAITSNYKNLINNLYILLNRIFEDPYKKDLSKVLSYINDMVNNEDIKMDLDELSQYYPVGGIHTTKEGHDSKRELEEMIKKGKAKEIKESFEKIKKLEENYDLASIVATNLFQFEDFKVLFIDDNPKIEKFEELVKYFPDSAEIYITDENEWEQFLENKFWESMYKRKAKLKLIKVNSNNDSEKNETNLFVPDSKEFMFKYVVVDLLMGNYNEGNKIINKLFNFRKNFNRINGRNSIYFDLITFSRSEETLDITRALNEGSIFYVPKSRYKMLPSTIAKLEKKRRIIEKKGISSKKLYKSRNFGKLYKLPEELRRKLQYEPFLNLIQTSNSNNLNEYLKLPSFEWIKKIPKAELHYHMGGSIPTDAVFFMSLNMITEIEPEKIKVLIEEITGLMKLILKEDNIINLFKRLKKISNICFEIYKKNKNISKIFSMINKYLKEIFKNDQVKINTYKRAIKLTFIKFVSDKEKINEVVIEKYFFDLIKNLNEDLDNPLPPYQIVNVFNVILGFYEGMKKKSITDFWSSLKILTHLKNSRGYGSIEKNIINKIILKMDLKQIKNPTKTIIKKNKELFYDLKSVFNKKNNRITSGEKILSHFISAKKRKTSSLSEYLGGNEFVGSEQLMKKENIVMALFRIAKKNVEDNVRYLEIRLSPDGYVGDNLSLQESVSTLLWGTDLVTRYFYREGKFIKINFIFTVKRHKPPDQAAIEVSAAIVNRERQKFIKDAKEYIDSSSVNIINYKWGPSRVVGVDMAGIEKGNPARNFINDFYPLFKTSSFITIHAGEEETAQSIWEAVYLLHANRIGHGLTLQGNKYLMDLLKNLQVCVEMNPISNLLTNPQLEKNYPFFEFFNEGLNVTINTDNQSVSDSSLSEEYLRAASLYQMHKKNNDNFNISKWDILRIVKNGFNSSFLDREEKRLLISAIEEEIYQKLIVEYGF